MKFFIQKAIIVDQPLEKVRPLISDFNQWKSWSPWAVIEPNHTRNIWGKVGTVGHTLTWSGEIIGAGTITISAEKFAQISYNLEFQKPQKSKSTSEFLFERVGKNKTEITWNMTGNMPWFLFWMIPMIKFLIGMDYDRGLKMLKSVAETGTVKAKTTHEGIVDFVGFEYVGIKKTSHADDMATEMPQVFGQLVTDLDSKNNLSKHWISIYPKVNMRKGLFTYVAAASTENATKILKNNHITGSIKSGRMLKITHNGSYKFLGNAWTMGMMIMRSQKLKKSAPPFEYYHNNPQDTPEDDLITDIYFPVK
jgi:predicted transcriptional regulator YdeE